MREYGRWPWSWPVEVPVRVDTGRGDVHLTKKGVVYDYAAHVGKGYSGTCSVLGDSYGLPPITLQFKVGRSYLRQKLRTGEWKVV
jgi:hypothetical protein